MFHNDDDLMRHPSYFLTFDPNLTTFMQGARSDANLQAAILTDAMAVNPPKDSFRAD